MEHAPDKKPYGPAPEAGEHQKQEYVTPSHLLFVLGLLNRPKEKPEVQQNPSSYTDGNYQVTHLLSPLGKVRKADHDQDK